MRANATASIQSRKAKPVDLHVGERIRIARLLGNISQVELAKRCDITFQQVQKYERGLNRVSASRLVQLAQALNRPLGWFFEGLPDYPTTDVITHLNVALVRKFNALPARQQQAILGLINDIRPEHA